MSIRNINSILSLTIPDFEFNYYFSISYYFLAPLPHSVGKLMPCFYVHLSFWARVLKCHMNTTVDQLLVVLFNFQSFLLDGIYHISRISMSEYSIVSLTNNSEDIPNCSINEFFKAIPFSSARGLELGDL